MLELELSFLKPAFDQIQAELTRRYNQNINERGTKNLKQYADNELKHTLLALEEKIERQLTQQLGSQSRYTKEQIKAFAQEILRREHIEHLSTLYLPSGTTKGFQINKENYTSDQIPVGKLHNCYRRWAPGLAAFRKHTFKKGDKTLFEYYHHSSPVVYEEPDFKKRINGTVENFKQVVRDTGGKPVTEIRLLSTTNKIGGDKKQAVETYLAAILSSTSEQPITVFFHGVNLARYLRATKMIPEFISQFFPAKGGFQTWLNTRSTNTLFEKILKQANIDNPDLLAIEKKRAELKQKVENLISSDANEETVNSKFKEYLEEHHKSEDNIFVKYKKLLLNNPKISQETDYDLKVLFDLLEADEKFLTPPQYNGQIQATLLRLSRRVGETVATGCNDAKDRDGMVSILVETNEIYRQKHGHYPNIIESKKSYPLRKEMKEIQTEVYQKSTAAPVAEYVSWPEMTKGLDNTAAPGSGFKHLPNDGSMAGYFKIAYHDFYKHHSKNVKNIILPKYKHKKPTEPLSKKWRDSSEFHVSAKDQKHDSGKHQKTLVFNEKTEKFREIDLNTEDPDATPANNRIEVYEREVTYQPDKIPEDKVLLKILKEAIKQAIATFTPEPKNIDDLQFNGNTKMKEMAKEIAIKEFNKNTAKPEPRDMSEDQSEEIDSESSTSRFG